VIVIGFLCNIASSVQSFVTQTIFGYLETNLDFQNRYPHRNPDHEYFLGQGGLEMLAILPRCLSVPKEQMKLAQVFKTGIAI